MSNRLESEKMSELSPYFILRNGEPPRDEFLRSRNAPKLDDGIGLIEVWRIVRRRIRLTLYLVAAAIFITGLVVFIRTPTFTARTTLLISPEAPQVLDMTQLMTDSAGDLDYDYYKTQFELLKGRVLAARVIKKLDLEHNSAFDPHKTPSGIAAVVNQISRLIASLSKDSETPTQVPEEYSVNPLTIDMYLSHLKIEPKAGTRLVLVTFTLPDPVLAAKIVNCHVDQFVRLGLEIHSNAQRTAREFLESELIDIGRRVQNAEAALNSYRQQNGVLAFDVDDTNKVAAQRMADLSKALTDAETRRITAESEMELVQHGQYESLPQVVSNPSISALRPQLISLEAEYARLSAAFNSEYPKLAELKAQLTEARAAMARQVRDIADAVSREYAASLDQEQKLREEIQAEKQRDLALNDALLKDAVLEREVETNRDLYKNVLERMQQMGVAEHTPLSNISIVEVASPPLRPSSPKKLIDITISGLIALFVGLGLSFLLEQLDNRLKSTEEVENYLHLPTLAIAPDFNHIDTSNGLMKLFPKPGMSTGSNNSSKNKSASDSVFEGYKTGKGEIYRTIRTGVLFSRAGSPPKTILVTSSVEGEGKTWTAVHTAVAFAQTGASTLLIDADLRRPNCHSMLDSENTVGLSEVLVGQCDASDLVQRKNGSSFYFLAAGSSPPNPAELLTSMKMRQVMDSLCEHYEYVVIDSAPLMYASDSIGIATMVDGVVVVLGANTAKQSAKSACDRLSRVGAKILGVVLNGVDIRHPDYREHGSYYFSYDSYNRGSDLLEDSDAAARTDA
jgi:polysaccharide biosynthesis transport protein